MNFDKNKTFPYPVLRPHSDDYVEVEFQATPVFKIDATQVELKCTYITSSTELATEITNGNACYVSTISCRDTYFRKALKTAKDELVEKFDANGLRGEVRVESYIVCLKPIKDFSSPDINKEFGAETFDFSPGQVMAQDQTSVVYIDRDLFKPVTSVFDLVKNDMLSGAEWRAGLGQDHVNIEVSASMKQTIDDARNSTPNKAILLNSIYFAAIVHAIQKLKEVPGEFGELKWGKVVTQQAQNDGINLETADAYLVAQRLMKYPLGHLSAYVFKGSDA